MSENMKQFINGIKETDFYAKYVDALFVSEEDPDTLYYRASKEHTSAERDAATSALLDLEISFFEIRDLLNGDDAFVTSALNTLKEV